MYILCSHSAFLLFFITCMGDELSTLSIPSPATLPPLNSAVKILKPTDNKFAQWGVGAIAYEQKTDGRKIVFIIIIPKTLQYHFASL